MYIQYDNLWKLLIDKKISKTELMSLTGMSSRTLAKLSKNQTVTTDTLLRICEVLDCGIEDIMEVCKGEEQKSFYQRFQESAFRVSKDEVATTWLLSFGKETYRIKKLNRTANKRTVICCEQNALFWEQMVPVGIGASMAKEKTLLTKNTFAGPAERGIVLIPGNPAAITGRGRRAVYFPQATSPVPGRRMGDDHSSFQVVCSHRGRIKMQPDDLYGSPGFSYPKGGCDTPSGEKTSSMCYIFLFIGFTRMVQKARFSHPKAYAIRRAVRKRALCVIIVNPARWHRCRVDNTFPFGPASHHDRPVQ